MDLETLYRRHAAVVFRRARRILGSSAEAEDALQDVFVKLQAALAGFRGEAEVLTWIYRITTNDCLNRLRHRRVEARAAEALAARPETHDPHARSELRALLETLLAALSTEDVAILFHRHADQMTQLEIAELTGLSERTIRDRLKALEAHVRAAERTLRATWEEP